MNKVLAICHCGAICAVIGTGAAGADGSAKESPAPAAAVAATAGGNTATNVAAATGTTNGSPGPAGEDWMNFGVQDSIAQDAQKKKPHSLKGQYFRLDVGYGETMPIEFAPDNGIFVKEGKNSSVFLSKDDFKGTRPELKTEGGVRVSAAAGYNFTEYAGIELEVSALYSRLTAVDVPGGGGHGASSELTGGSLWQIPVLANFVLQYPNRLNITPFVGIGGGLVFMYTSIEPESAQAFGLTDGIDPDGQPIPKDDRASGTVVVPAWQWFGGVRWEISKDIGIQGMYKYMATSDFSYNGELDGVQFDGAQSHTYSGGINFRF
ncbi:MAG TPA: outer membrane beta-barrel protein [Verrucomicrobiae bacterium]|nr:outer membrane beta-barrel protein [Verrucomicrobiae bacterium]